MFVPADTSAPPSPCHVCPPPCIYFTGGIKVMTHIDGYLLDRRRMQRVYILNGRSGLGKTQIVLKYAQTRRRFFSDILFIDGSSINTVKQSYTSFIVSKERGTTMEDSLRWLSMNKTNWLIVFDGANAPELEFRSLLPSCSHGNIIITTQRSSFPSSSEWPRSESRLTRMNQEDSLDLMARITGVVLPSPCSPELLDLFERVKYLPVPLTLAGLYLKKHSTASLDESCRLYCEEFSTHLTEQNAQSQSQRTSSQQLVQAACKIHSHGLDNHGWSFLQVLAFMHNRGISEEIFQRAAERLSTYSSTLPPTETETRVRRFLETLVHPFLDEQNTWNGAKFTQLMVELLDCSFVDLPQPGGWYSIPPCIHTTIAETLTKDSQFFCRVATHLLALSIDPTRDDHQELRFRQQISAHVDSVLIQGENVSLDEASRFVLVYIANGQLEEAETLQLEVVEFRKRILGEDHDLTLDSQERLDTIYGLQGKVGPDAHFENEDSLASLPYSQLFRRPRVAQNRISALDDIVKHFTLAAHLRDLTHELGPSLVARTSWGGLGDVYRTVMRDGTEVAIKTLRPGRSKPDGKITKYTAREIAAWSKLDHPNILEFLGLAVFQGQLVMVSPWMQCGDVVEYAKQRGVNRCSLCLQLSSAVAYMHGMHVVHGDIKGVNTLVSEDGIVKLTDFGLTIVQDPDVYISITEKGGGTERWMAPELLLEDTAVRSEKADVYALGMTFLEIFTGLAPFSYIRRNCAVVAMVTRGEKHKCPEDLSLYTRQSDRVWEILQQCWEWNPGERPAAQQIKEAFYEIM
ncbi:unnamed protein product [Rhizoctonia solani]|uniref:Protein kinase domain-containing protein n=1 Tax=Rhizoctonia solani TaxID=456999 RepID=A0A8H3DWC3_9AGAM|nr:unnamed protein product [Rhizoctonia solani]